MDKSNIDWRERTSESELIASVWSCSVSAASKRSVLADPTIAIAMVSEAASKKVFLRGPAIKPHSELLMPGYNRMSIRLQLGASLQGFLAEKYIDKTLVLPTDSAGRFQLNGIEFQFPDFNKAEVLIDELSKKGILQYDPRGQYDAPQGLSSKSFSRLVKRTTGLPPHKLHQLQRIHEALHLIKQGVPATTAAVDLGFVDQAHLIRAAKQYLGHTPKELLDLPQNP